MNIDFVKNLKIWGSISLAIVLIGIVVIGIQGLNLGVDFQGGTLIYASIGKSYNIAEVRGIVEKVGVKADVIYAGENKQDLIIKMNTHDNQIEIQDEIVKNLEEKYKLDHNKITIEMVGASIGKELVKNALVSIAIACLLILVYISIRFEFKSGIAAIIALVHDVLIMIAAVAIFRTQINSPFVAAVLTIIGYSINDTIVIFDRIRENIKRYGRKSSMDEIVNTSVKESLTRTINTSLTTLFTITALYILGVEAIKEFSAPIIVGLISGTYSSIFIAGPIWAYWSGIDTKKKISAKSAK